MQKARRHDAKAPLRPLVSVWFQVLFTPFFRVLFTFPSQYWFTIGLSGVFSLTRWCWQFHTGFLRPRATQDTDLLIITACTGLSPCFVTFSKRIPLQITQIMSVLQPHSTNALWFGLFRVRSPLLAESLLVFSSSGYLDVSVPRVRLAILCIQMTIPLRVGFPIRRSADHRILCSSPRLIAAYRVLHRL